MKVTDVKDGETLVLKPGRPQPIICCDCGLTHDFTLSENAKEPALIKITRDEKMTAYVRKNSKKWGFSCFPKEDK